MRAADRSDAAVGGGMSTVWHEQALVFECAGSRLVGVLTLPEAAHDTAVLIVVGGPQYRAGSHRQFTLLARHLGDRGIASLRFDYRGMGDSEGEMRTFEQVGEDIRAALDALFRTLPSLRAVVLWGLCDAASAAMLYAPDDARVSGLVLLNPWVHSEAGAARARLKHYYLARLLQRSFWVKLLSGKFSLKNSASDLVRSARVAGAASERAADSAPWDPRHGTPGFIGRMLEGLRRYRGRALFIVSGNDLTGQEFVALAERDAAWRRACRMPGRRRETLPGANHTFSTRAWRDRAADWTARWVREEN